LYVLADLHIGDPQSDYAECCKRVDQVKNDERGLCIINGDIMNVALRNSVGDIYGEQLSPMKQLDAMVTLLKPIKDKVIGVTTGNHEARVYHEDGIDMMRLAYRELGIEDKYAPEGVLIFLRFGKPLEHGKQADSKQWYSIYATHGNGGGRKEGSKIIRLAELAAIVDADVYIHSHSHLPIITKEAYFRVSAAQSSAKVVDKLFVNTGAAMDYGGYVQEKTMKPASKATPVITMTARDKLATATL
jgi:predicted phosphodiesterase